MRKLALWYDREAPYGNEYIEADGQQPLCDDDGWEKWSLPIGNGYMGVNVFRANHDRAPSDYGKFTFQPL